MTRFGPISIGRMRRYMGDPGAFAIFTTRTGAIYPSLWRNRWFWTDIASHIVKGRRP